MARVLSLAVGMLLCLGGSSARAQTSETQANAGASARAPAEAHESGARPPDGSGAPRAGGSEDSTGETVGNVLLITGGASFGIAYGMSVVTSVLYLALIFPFQHIIAETPPDPSLTWLLVPVAGPFLAAKRGVLEDHSGWNTIMHVNGILQSAGLGLLLTGLIIRAASDTSSSQRDGETTALRLRPMLTQRAAGASAHWTF